MEVHDEFLKARRTCTEEPTRANCRAALFYAVGGRLEDAKAMYRSGSIKSQRTPNLIMVCALFGVAHKLLAGRAGDAVAVFDRALANHRGTIEKWRAFNFYLISHRVMERLIEGGKKSVRLMSADHLPTAMTDGRRESEVSLPELSAWLLEEATAIGRQFDKRNDADYFSKRIEARWPFVLGAPD